MSLASELSRIKFRVNRVRVTLQLSVSQSFPLGVEPLWDSWPDFGCSQDSWGLFVMGRLPWREDRSVMLQVTVLVCVGGIYICTFL